MSRASRKAPAPAGRRRPGRAVDTSSASEAGVDAPAAGTPAAGALGGEAPGADAPRAAVSAIPRRPDAAHAVATIRIRGARTHNLRGVDLDLPRGKLVVITGPSGSGKSSLAFDTIFAEGQRRYVESLSVAARQHLSQLPKPDADLIEGLSPAVAISQQAPSKNPRATVGTTTELLDFLRLLFARLGTVVSPATGQPLRRWSIEQMVTETLTLPADTRFSVMAPVAAAAPGDHAELLESLRRAGFVRVLIDDEVRDLGEPIALDPERRHDIAVYVDRLKMKEGLRGRLADSIEIAARLSGGVVEIAPLSGAVRRFAEHYEDPEHGVSVPELTPALFSFNSPAGACPACDGVGTQQRFDPRLIVDPASTLASGAIRPWRRSPKLAARLPDVAAHFGADPDAPWSALPEEVKVVVLQGSGEEAIGERPFEGVVAWLRRRLHDRAAKAAGSATEDGAAAVAEISQYARAEVCDACQGARLRPEALIVQIGGKSVAELSAMTLSALSGFVDGLHFEAGQAAIATAILERVRERLRFLLEVGLGYLSLQRPTTTLSGGELQRIRLATQVGNALVGVTYVLDEPSIGLHPRDNDRLIATLLRLRDLGNSLIVVEHDADTMRAADYLVDMGPGAGRHGGTVVAAGSVAEVMACPGSATGRALAGEALVPVPAARRRPGGRSLRIVGARGHNLQGITVRIPLGLLTCVTGVSGSGKSTLILDTLLPEAGRIVGASTAFGLPHETIEGLDHLDKVIHVDQSPIGRSPKSNPATFTGVMGDVRNVFAQLPEAKVRGWGPSRFSFNVKGGRCKTCAGEGQRRVEMHFLADVFVQCDACGGRRYGRDTLTVTMRGKNIADVLEMTIAEAFDFFVTHPAIRAKLEVLRDVGLGYLTLGQSAVTLSGGEAQRIKLAKELAKRSTGSTLFILDEPTTGLHVTDVGQLLGVLQRLVDEGNTVVVIEHDLDVIKSADHVIDIGPDGGAQGGTVVAAGTPEAVAKSEASHTARYLRAVLG